MRFVTRLLMFAAALLLPTALGLRAERSAMVPSLAPPAKVITDGRVSDVPTQAWALSAPDVEYLTLDLALPDGLPRCRYTDDGRTLTNRAHLPTATGRAANRQRSPA